MTRRLWWALALVLMVSTPAFAQLKGGVRAGVSGGPTQFVFGGHVETNEIVDRLTFRPSFELGFGDGQTIAAFNIEFAYWLPAKTEPWRIYIGAGPALLIGHVTGNTESGGGFNFLGGVQHTSGLFFEMKVGAADSPRFKFMVGYQIKSK